MYAYTIGTLRGSTLVNVFDWGTLFIWVPCWFTCWIFFSTTSLTGTLGCTAGGFVLLSIFARVLNSSFCPLPILTRGLAGAGFCSAYIKSCASQKFASMEDIYGMLNFFGGNFTVFDILSALVLEVYAF